MTKLLSPVDHAALQARGLSRISETSTLRIPSKYYSGGFGQDLPPDIEQAWLLVLAQRPRISWQQALTERVNAKAEALAAWKASLKNSIDHGHIPIEESRILEIDSAATKLQLEFAYLGLNLNQIGFRSDDPNQVAFPKLPVAARWRHYAFTAGLFAPGLTNLPTVEMEEPPMVWDRLLKLFEDYIALRSRRSWHELSVTTRQREKLQLYLALYERILILWYQARIQILEYQRTISQRVPLPNAAADRILPIPGMILDDSHVPMAQQYRTQAYHDLLMWLLHKVVHRLNP